MDFLILMGPPGCGKTYLGHYLSKQSMAEYTELEPVLVERFGTGAQFRDRKAEALVYIEQQYLAQRDRSGLPIVLESTGLSDRTILERLTESFRVAFVKVRTPRATCLERIANRERGRNLSNDVEAAGRFYDYWTHEIAPTYSFDLEVSGTDVQEATSAIQTLL